MNKPKPKYRGKKFSRNSSSDNRPKNFSAKSSSKGPWKKSASSKDSTEKRYRADDSDSQNTSSPENQFRKKNQERAYYGRNACLALFKKRPGDILRAYLLDSLAEEFKPLMKFCAENKLPYSVCKRDELDRVSSSNHHEGVCVVAKRRDATEFDIHNAPNLGEGCLVCLDGVENPHNFGSILRSCANFGVRGVLGKKGSLPTLSGAACRVAEGGAEHLQVDTTVDLVAALAELKKSGYKIVVTTSDSKQSLFKASLPRKLIFVFGSEGQGISPEIMALKDLSVSIPGTKTIQSLNVSSAASVVLAEYYRQHLVK